MSELAWEETAVIGSGQGPIYVKSGVDTDQLVEEMESITGPDGRVIFESVHRTTDLYPDVQPDRTTPKLIAEQRPGVHTTDSVGAGNVFELPTQRGKWRAENNKIGLFAACGPNITDAWERDRIDICQVMPTVLSVLGSPVPTDVSSGPLPLSVESSETTYREPIVGSTHSSGTGSDEMEERLRDLGYLE